MSDYTPTIGLEIHAELKTRTKMFCDSPNNPDEEQPNVNICPICLGHPGTLPVINRAAVKHVLRVGVALGADLADFTEFDRKNYFYPDIPKGYQISQYKYPLVSGGELAGVKIHRVHLEEDTARSLHKDTYSILDFNRSGLPLMELVTDPVIKTAEEASIFAKELQLLLRALGASEANMEKGQMRVEANISISKDNTLGTKVEVKNLNSFKAVERAIAYEVKRQTALLDRGEKVLQETRGWDENRQSTFSQRLKEESHDYRYFPDPDLPKLHLSEIPEFSRDAISTELPELPVARRARYKQEYTLSEESVEILVGAEELSRFFEAATGALKTDDRKQKTLLGNYLLSDIVGLLRKEALPLEHIATRSPEEFAKIITMISRGALSSRGGKDLIALWLQEGTDPETLAEKAGLIQENNRDALNAIVKKVISENESAVTQYKAGKAQSLQFLVGQAMRHSKGSANPETLQELLIQYLS